MSPPQGEPNLAAIQEHLADLWPDGVPAGAWLTLWDPASGRAQFSDIEEAAKVIADGRHRYLTTALMSPQVGRARGGANDALAIPGLFGDIDFLGGNHKETRLPTERQALDFLEQLPLPPTFTILSGGGAYPAWLFREPWIFDDDEDRALAAQLSCGWQSFIIEAATSNGWRLDNVGSLAQILRPPGTLNEKYDPPRMVRRVEGSRVRCNPSDFEPWCIATPHAAHARCELPAELPESIRTAVAALQTGTRIKSVAGRIQAVVLDVCPECGGVQRSRRGTARETAHVSPLSGRLKCKRESCEARQKGLEFEDWVCRFLPPAIAAGVLDQQRSELDAQRAAQREPLIPEDADRVSLADADAGRLDALLDEAAEHARTSGSISLVITPVGSGKTRTLCDRMKREPHAAYLAPSHKLLNEVAQELLARGVDYVLVEGAGRACRYPDAFKKYGRRSDWRGTACQDCPHLANGSCGAWSWMSKAQAGSVILAAHESIDMLHCMRVSDPVTGEKYYLLEERDIFIDEDPGALDVVIVGRDAVRVPLDNPAVFGLIAPVAIQVSQLIEGLLAQAALEYQASRPEYGMRWEGDLLHALWLRACREQSPDAVKSLLFQAAGIEEWPAPAPADLRHARAAPEDWPHPDLRRVWQALPSVALLDAEERARCARSKGHVELLVNERGAWLELRLARPIPTTGAEGAVICDATGSLTRRALEAAHPGVPVKTFGLAIAPNPWAEIERLHLLTKSASRRRLCPDGECSERTFGMLRNVLRVASKHAARVLGDGAHRVALLTFMAIALALLDDADALEEIAPPNLILSPGAIGYYGLDDRGSNRFRDQPILVTLGDPIDNVGATEADARALGIDSQYLIGARVDATLVQAQGRARALRAVGPKLLVHVGRICPQEGSWSAEELPVGRPRSDEVVGGLVRRLLDAGEIAAAPLIEGLCSAAAALESEGLLSRDKTAFYSLVGSFVPSTRTLRRAVERAALGAGATNHSARLGRSTWTVWRPAAMPEDLAEERAREAWEAIQGVRRGSLVLAERWVGRLDHALGGGAEGPGQGPDSGGEWGRL